MTVNESAFASFPYQPKALMQSDQEGGAHYRVFRDDKGYERVQAESVPEAIRLSGIAKPSRIERENPMQLIIQHQAFQAAPKNTEAANVDAPPEVENSEVPAAESAAEETAEAEGEAEAKTDTPAEPTAEEKEA